ncbi:MAG: isochorismatase family protein [Rhizobiaceae bacterium]
MVATSVPETSCLLIVEPTADSLEALPAEIRSKTATKFNSLDEAADLAKVPRYFATYEANKSKRDKWLSHPCENVRQRVFPCLPTQAPWQNDELVTAIKSEKRERLFVCGFWLDASLGSAALEAFVEGFDVHLLVDLSFSKSEIGRADSIHRLTQYGIVPITISQMIFEWMSWTSDHEAASALKSIASNLPA